MAYLSNHRPEELERLNAVEPDSYTPTPADEAEFYRFAHPARLDGLKALLAQLDQLAADAKRNHLTTARGRAQRHHYVGLETAYKNVGAWLRLELARLEA